MTEEDFITATSRVVIDVRDGLSVRPEDAVIRIGAPLEWDVRGLETGQALEISFHVKGGVPGPFVPQGSATNPRRGRYTAAAAGAIRTAESDQIGFWKYDLVLTTPGKGDVAIDPGVLIKGGDT
jgi:hypothetical protein